MKTKLKVLISLCLTALSALIVTATLGKPQVQASSAILLTQTYEVYKKDDWDAYISKKIAFDKYWNTTVSVDSMEDVIFSLSGNNTKKNQAKNAIRNCSWTYGYFNPKDIMDLNNANITVKWPADSDYTDLHSYWDWTCDPADRIEATDSEGNAATISPYQLFGGYIEDLFDSTGQFIPFNKPAQATSAKPGVDKLVVAVYITSNEPVYNYAIGPNLHNYATNVVATNYAPDGWSEVNSGKKTYVIDSVANDYYIYGAGAPNTSSCEEFNDYLALTLGFDLASTASGTLDVSKANFSTVSAATDQNHNNNTQVSDSDGTNGNMPKAYKANGADLVHFAWNETSFTAGATKSTTTDIKNIVVTEQPSGTPKNGTASSATGVDYEVSTDFTPSTTSSNVTANMTYKVADSGTVTWIEKSDNGTTWSDFSSATGSSSSPVSLTDNQTLNGILLPQEGQSIYLKFHITAEDTTKTGEKVLRLSTTPKLKGFSIKADAGSGEVELVGTDRFFQTATPTAGNFDADVLGYTIKIPYDSSAAKTVKIAGDYLAGQTVKVDGNAQSSATDYKTVTIPASTSASSVSKNVVVTGANGTSTTTYVITIELLADKKSLDSMAVGYTDASGTAGTKNMSTSTTTGVDYEITLGFGETLTGLIPTSTGVQSISAGTAVSSLTPVASGGTFTITSTNAPAAGSYKDYYVRVTSNAGNTQDFVIRVNKEAANTDAGISNIVFKNAAGTANLGHTANADGTEFTITNPLEAKETSFIFIPTFNSKSTAAFVIGGGTVTSAANNTVSMGAVSTTAINNDTIQFKITPESGASDAKTYTIKYSRKAANNDHTVNVEVFNGTTALATGTADTTTTAQQLTYLANGDSKTLIMPAGYGTGTGNLNYDVTSVNVKVKFDTTKAIKVINSSGSTIANNADIQSVNFGATSTTATSKTVTFTVKSEYEDLTGAAGYTYTLNLERDPVNDSYKYFVISYYYVDKDGNPVYDGTGTTQFTMIESTTSDVYNDYHSTMTTNKIPFNVKEIHYTINRPTTGIPTTTDILVSGSSIIGVEQIYDVTSSTSTTALIQIPLTVTTQKTTHNIKLNFDRAPGQSGKKITIEANGVTTTNPISGVDDGSYGRKFTVDPTSDTKIVLNITPQTSNPNDLLNSDRAKIYVTDVSSDKKKYEYGVDPDMQISVPASIPPASTTVFVYVFPEDGSAEQMYTVTVYRKDNRSNKNGIVNIEFVDDSGNPISVKMDAGYPTGLDYVYNASTLTYDLRVPYSTTSLKFRVETEDGKATLAQPSSVLTDSSNTAIHTYTKSLTNTGSTPNTVKFQAKAENGTVSTKTYEFNIYRETARTGNNIESLKINNVEFTSASTYFATNNDFAKNVLSASGNPLSSFPVEFTVSAGATWTATDFFTSLPNATVNPTSGVATFNIVVTSESGVPKTYKFKLYSAYEDFSLDNIELFKDNTKAALTYDGTAFAYNSSTTSYTVKLPYSMSTVSLLATIGSTNAKGQSIYIDGTKLSAIDTGTGDLIAKKDYSTIAINPLTTDVKVKVKSQYAELNSAVNDQEKEYTLTISRTPADSDSTLKSLTVTAGGKNFGTFLSSQTTGYKIEEISATSAAFSAEPNSSKAKVVFKTWSGAAGETISGTAPLSISTTGTRTETFTFEVTAEDGSKSTYEVVLSVDKITLDTVNNITDISVFANGDASTNLMTGTNAYLDTKTEYEITIPGTETGVKIQATPGAATATITFDGSPASNKNTANKTYTIAEGSDIEVVIGCNSESGVANTTTYKIKIKRAARDTDNSLKSLTVDSNPVTSPYKIHLPNGTTSTTIGATANSAKAVVTGDIGTVNTPKYENQFTVTITAEDGSVNNITVTVYVDEPVTLSALSVKDVLLGGEHVSDFAPNKTLYKVNFDYDMDAAEISFLPTGDLGNGLTITLDGDPFPISKKLQKAVNVGTNTYQLEVKTETDSKIYNIEITRASGNGDNFILEYIKAGTVRDEFGVLAKASDWNPSSNSYEYIVDREVTKIYFNALTDAQVEAGEDIETTTLPNITLKISPNAKIKAVSPNSTNLNVGTNVFSVDVESQTGSINTYKFTVIRADSNSDIEDIDLLLSSTSTDGTLDIDGNTFEYDPTTKTYTFVVPYTTDKTFLKIKPKSTFAKVYLNTGAGYQIFANSLQTIDQGDTAFKIQCRAEVETYLTTNTYVSDEYTIKITRNLANSDAKLKELHAVVTKTDGTKQDLILNFDPDTKSYVIENLDEVAEPNIQSIDIKAVPNVASTKVENVKGTFEKNYQLTSFTPGSTGATPTGYVFNFSIKTEAEDGTSTEEYKINISRGPLDISDTKEINSILVTDSASNKYLGDDNTYTQKFDPATKTYTYELPYSVQSYTIDILKPTYDTSTKNGTGQFTVSKTDYGTTKNHTVFLTSEKGNNSEKYNIEIKIGKPSGEARLEDFIINGVSGKTKFAFDKDTQSYTYPDVIPYNDSIIKIEGIPVDPNATVDPAVETEKTLAVGMNSLPITVTAEDGTQKTYTVIVKRDFPDAKLEDLAVSGYPLYEKNTFEEEDLTSFDPDVKEYYVEVPYDVTTAPIQIEVPDSSYQTTCTNSTTPTLTSGINRTFDGLQFAEGMNTFTIDAVSGDGKKVQYKVYVNRLGKETTYTTLAGIDITPRNEVNKDITTTVDDYLDDNNKDHTKPLDNVSLFNTGLFNTGVVYGYDVPNKVTSLDVTFDPAAKKQKVEVFGADNLKVGENPVVIVVTSADGKNSRAVVLNVTRKPMEYEVKADADQIQITNKKETVSPEDGTKLTTVEIDLGKTKLKDDDATRKLFADYIKFDEENNNISVEVLTNLDSPAISEVLVKVTDGDVSDLVAFKLANATGVPSNFMDLVKTWWPLFISILAAIILLILILISVNRDKYGKINKNRKHAD